MADTVQLNKAQLDALDLRRNVALRAVAGSGKTTVLVHRYLKILEDEPATNPADILAITFSESAARQLRAKLGTEIRDRTTVRRWREIYHALSDAPISTIHAFCAARLREHAIEAGVDPDFAILDEIDADMLVAEAVEQTYAGASEGSNLYSAILTVASNLTHKPGKLLEKLITRREVFAPLVDEIQHTSCERMVELAREQCYEAYRTALDRIEQSGLSRMLGQLTDLVDSATGTARSTIESVRDVRASLARARSNIEGAGKCFDQLQKVFMTQQGKPKKGKIGGKRDWNEPDLHDRYKRLFAEAARIVERLELADIPLFNLRLEELAAETLHALIDVYRECLAGYTESKRLRRTLDFSDLQERFVDMIETYPHIRRSLSKRFRHILVDEFQDTNRLQWRIVRLLANDDSGRLRSRGLFIVGDEAQSIYGFRNAEVEVFQEARSGIRATADGVEVPSTQNFRSGGRVLAAVNELFEPEHDYLELIPHRDKSAGTVEVITVESSERNKSRAVQCGEEARTVANRILTATQPGPMAIPVEREHGFSPQAAPGDIAILLRGRTHLQPVLDALRAAGIPYYTDGGTGFFRQQEIWDLLNALRSVASADNEIAMAGYLRSPLAGVSDEALLYASMEDGNTFSEKLHSYAERSSTDRESALVRDAVDRLETWRKQAGRVTIDSLLRTICDDTGLWMALACNPRAPQPEENVKRLIDMARSYSATESRSIRKFLDRMDYLVEKQWPRPEPPLAAEAQNAVRVMTVHQAKGLEFPIVFVMQCHLKYNFGTRHALRIHRTAGIGFKCPDPSNNYERAETVGYRLVRQADQQYTRDEEMRLLHVACTRARDALILSGYGKEPDPDNWWHFVRTRLPDTSELVIHRANIEPGTTTAMHTETASASRLEVVDELAKIAEGGPPLPESISAETRRMLDGLERIPSAPRDVDMSPTQWMMYCQCPRRYFYRWIIGADEPGTGEKSYEEAAPAIRQDDETHHDALEFGRIVHRAFELYVTGNDIDRAADSSLAEFQYSVPQVKHLIRTILHQFAESAVGRSVANAAEKRAEQPFVMKVAGMNVRGSIDLVWMDESGRWNVVDYKTSRSNRHSDADQVRHTRLAGRYEPQLALYALAVQRLHETDAPVSRTLYFTDAPGHPHEYPLFTDVESESLRNQMAAAATVISTDPIRVSLFPRAASVLGKEHLFSFCDECGFHRAGICENEPPADCPL